MSTPPTNLFYEFGAFRLDAREHRLLRDGELVPLTHKAVDTLRVLIEHRGQLVERNDLMKAVWGDVTVEDGNLSVAVSMLRKALSEGTDLEKYIETIPKRGYKFVANAREIVEDLPELVVERKTVGRLIVEEEFPLARPSLRTAWRFFSAQKNRVGTITLIAAFVAIGGFKYFSRNNSMHANAVPIRSIAVLPFKTIDARTGENHEGLGLADILITRLSNIRELNVRPTSAVAFLEATQGPSVSAGDQLHVDAVLEGSIFHSGDTVRVTTRLIRVSDQAPIWAGQFEKSSKDQLRLQDEIAMQVVDALSFNLSNKEERALTKRYTESADAYQLYLKGRYEWNKRDNEGLANAQYLFRTAIQKDPNFALAYVGLADSLAFAPQSAELHSAVAKALELDPNLGEAHATKGFILTVQLWKWAEAEESFKKAIDLNPGYATAHHWYAVLLEIEGRFEEAKSEMRRALEINPMSYNFLTDLGQIYYFDHKYDQAKQYCTQALKINPDFLFAHDCLAVSAMLTSDYETYINETAINAAGLSRGPFSGTDSEAAKMKTWREYQEIYHKGGIEALVNYMAESSLDSPDTNPNRFSGIAMMYSLLGKKEKALDYLEKAVEARAFAAAWAKADPRFDALRSEPRYKAILQKMNL